MATEADYTRTIVDALRRMGWIARWYPDSRRMVGDKGEPDILAVRQGRLALIEVKVKGGRIGPEQVRWAQAIDLVSVNAPGVVSYHYVRAPDGIDALLERLR